MHHRILRIPEHREEIYEERGHRNRRFTLLADAEKEIANKYGVMKEKNMYGKKVMGVARTEPLSPAARRQRAVLSMSSDLFFRPECAGVGGPYPEYAPKHFQLKLFF
jgi:hypothetical protein